MKRPLPIIFLLLSSLALAQDVAVKSFRDFSGCLNDVVPPSKLADNFSPNTQNMWCDEEPGALVKRSGSDKCGELPSGRVAVDLFTYRDHGGTERLIAGDGINLYRSADCTNWTIFHSTLAGGTNELDCVVADDVTGDGQLVCTNGTDAVFRCPQNCTTSTRVDMTFIPEGQYLEYSNNRLWIGPTTDRDDLYFSYIANSSGTRISPFVSDAWRSGNRISVGRGDGQDIRGMKTWRDSIIVFKDYRTFRRIGSSEYDFDFPVVSESVGSRFNRTIIEDEEGGLNFMSPDCHIYSYDGESIERLSRNIENSLCALEQITTQIKSNIQTTQADWEAGNLDMAVPRAVSAIVKPNSIQPSTWSVIETQASDWAKLTDPSTGTFTNVSTTSVPGALVRYQSGKGTFINAGAEQNSGINYTVQTGWSASTSCGSNCLYNASLWSGGNSASSGKTLRVRILNEEGTSSFFTATFPVPDGLIRTTATIDTSRVVDDRIILEVVGVEDENENQSVPFLRPDFLNILYRDANGLAANVDINYDVDESGGFVTSGNFTSRIFDTGISTPSWGNFEDNTDFTAFASFSSSITYYVQSATSSNSGALQTRVIQSTGTKIQANQSRYIRQQAVFSMASATNTPSLLYDTTLKAATTGQYVTQCINSTSMSGWGQFEFDFTIGNSSTVIAMSTGTTCSGATTLSNEWSPVISGQTPNIATAAFHSLRFTFNQLSGDNGPTPFGETPPSFEETLTRWTEGGSTQKGLASINFKNRNWMTGSLPGSSFNNRIYVNGKDDPSAWTRFIGLNIRKFTIFSDDLYGIMSSSSAVLKLETGTSDENASGISVAIDSFWQTKDEDYGLFGFKKSPYKMKVDFDDKGSGSFDIGYSTTTGSLFKEATHSMIGPVGRNYKRFLPLGNPPSFNIRYRLRNNNVGESVTFYGLDTEVLKTRVED